MKGLVLTSDLLLVLCNESQTINGDIIVPNGGRNFEVLSFSLGAVYLSQALLYIGLAVTHKKIVLDASDKTSIFVSQLFSGLNLACFYLSGGGIHYATEHWKKVIQLVSFGLALSFSFLSALMWVDLKRKMIVATLRFREIKQVSSSWTLRVAVLLPGLIGLIYCMILAFTVSCVPFVSLYRRFCGFMLGMTIMLLLVNFYYMRQTLDAMAR